MSLVFSSSLTNKETSAESPADKASDKRGYKCKYAEEHDQARDPEFLTATPFRDYEILIGCAPCLVCDGSFLHEVCQVKHL